MQRILYRLLLVIPIAFQGIALPLIAAEERIFDVSADDKLTIRSKEARMDDKPDIIHFAGGFELRANDWYLSSEQATLYGKLDNPETVVITGQPAVILVNALILGRSSMVNGEASRITYQRTSDSILMEGNAWLSRDGHTLNGGKIEYDIKKDFLRAGGDGGVHIRVKPDP